MIRRRRVHLRVCWLLQDDLLSIVKRRGTKIISMIERKSELVSGNVLVLSDRCHNTHLSVRIGTMLVLSSILPNVPMSVHYRWLHPHAIAFVGYSYLTDGLLYLTLSECWGTQQISKSGLKIHVPLLLHRIIYLRQIPYCIIHKRVSIVD